MYTVCVPEVGYYLHGHLWQSNSPNIQDSLNIVHVTEVQLLFMASTFVHWCEPGLLQPLKS